VSAPDIIHATTVALGGRALALRGASGSGKSALALQLVALGAELVADDRTLLTVRDGRLLAAAPAPIKGLIEARGVGILGLPAATDVPLVCVVDLDRTAVERLPQPEVCDIAGVTIPLLRKVDAPHFAASLFSILHNGLPMPADQPIAHDLPAAARRPAAARVVLVTGPSGAGRSTALAALEDLGFETIDNLPLSLLPRVVDGPQMRPLALGVDTRNRDFSVAALLGIMDQLALRDDIAAEAVYLDTRREVLVRRYSETRRRHPMAPDETPAAGIAREMDLLAPVRARAQTVVDTSELTPHDLRAQITRWFDAGAGPGLAVSLQSFSYKRGLPAGADMVFDVRFLQNPYWRPDLRHRNGLDPAVAAHVAEDPRFGEFFTRICDLTLMLLPAYAAEGKTHLAIAFGCTGGQHRSVAVAERLSDSLRQAGWRVSLRHREMERSTGHGAGAEIGKDNA